MIKKKEKNTNIYGSYYLYTIRLFFINKLILLIIKHIVYQSNIKYCLFYHKSTLSTKI